MVNFNNNPDELQEQIGNEFRKFKWDKFSDTNGCNISGKFELNKTQRFISEYFTPKNPNGILLYHTVGSGKTLTGLNLIKHFNEKGFNAIWVTRTTLRKDLEKSLKLLPINKSFPVFSYKQLSNIAKGANENYKALMAKTKTNDPLNNTILIIDEAHKLFTKDLKPQEMHNIKAIQKLIYDSYINSGNSRVRVVLMSATPVTGSIDEILNLLNLIIVDQNKRLTGDFESLEFKEKTKGIISYLDLSGDPSKFAKVSYTEVFTNMSNESTLGSVDCRDVIKDCISLGHSRDTCSEAKKNCLYSKKIKEASKGKSQATVLQKRCKVSID
jgi:small nuclear ribonucleoprotein (snRNP)-like protein